MKTKLIILLLVLSVVLFSGCAGNEQTSPEENATPEETVTPEEVTTPEEVETPAVTETEEENVTAEENETELENVTAEENETEGQAVSSANGRVYTIRLDNYKASASSLDINEGETVAWLNYQDSPRRVFTLVSEQGLFNNTSLSYRRSFAYTFNETGEYNFTVIGQPKMNVTVTVS
jgi:plastocyanin